MTRAAAHDLLDRVKAGLFVSRATLDEALRATGDLSPWKASEPQPAIPRRWSEYAADNIRETA